MAKMRFERDLVGELGEAIRRMPDLIHVLVGARQTGKSTAAEQVAGKWKGPVILKSADLALPPGPEWVENLWNQARLEARQERRAALLVLDEIQKVHGWSETVKALRDEDRRSRTAVRPLILGSSALLVQKGLTESLAGRFFLHRSPHWSYSECRRAFGWTLDQWIFYGGYPGAAKLVRDEEAWRRYVSDSLVETAISRDVLQLQTVAKPALLRHLFGLAAQYPAQIVSYTKMLGSLQDAGNTVTLAHYLRLLESAFLVSGLERMTGQKRRRGSIPKLVLWNNALISSLAGGTFREARRDAAYWGRLVENAVGAHLLNSLSPPRFAVGYWRDGNDEVDYVVHAGRKTGGIEVKSGRPGRSAGLGAFRKRFPSAKSIIVGGGGIELKSFFENSPNTILDLA